MKIVRVLGEGWRKSIILMRVFVSRRWSCNRAAPWRRSIGQWHTVRALENGTVMLEVKDGRYEPIGPEDILG